MSDSTQFWLMKCEPGVFSIDDLQRDKRTHWDGVRNYKARNFMRDEMKIGDRVLYYHSNADPSGVAGLARVCKTAYPDFTALEPRNKYYDPKATKEKPVWYMVDIEFAEKFPHFVSLQEIRDNDDLDGIMVIRRGMRLSIQPVEAHHFDIICTMGRSG